MRIAALLLLVALTGCATHPAARYTVTEPLQIVVAPVAEVARLAQAYGHPVRDTAFIAYGAGADGCDLIVVPQHGTDDHGRALPNMEALGHEIWHRSELGGPNWHGGNE